MATRIDLHRDRVYTILKAGIASMQRAEKAASNPGIKMLLQKDIAEHQAAMNTLTEIK